jgi:hypothetical protein
MPAQSEPEADDEEEEQEEQEQEGLEPVQKEAWAEEGGGGDLDEEEMAKEWARWVEEKNKNRKQDLAEQAKEKGQEGEAVGKEQGCEGPVVKRLKTATASQDKCVLREMLVWHSSPVICACSQEVDASDPAYWDTQAVGDDALWLA